MNVTIGIEIKPMILGLMFLMSSCLCYQSLSCVWLFVNLWTAACQAPLSLEYSRQEYWSWSRSPFPTPEALLHPGIASLASSELAGRFSITSATWEVLHPGSSSPPRDLHLLHLLNWQADSLLLVPPGKFIVVKMKSTNSRNEKE